MPNFRIYRMKEAPRQSFRWAPHVSGSAQVKQKDYELDLRAIDAPHEYAAWAMLQHSEQPILVGDLLANQDGELRICKYVGFESALWIFPAGATETVSESAAGAASLAVQSMV